MTIRKLPRSARLRGVAMALSAGAVAVAGCTLGPAYVPPLGAAPPAFDGLASGPQAAPLGAITGASADLAAWWSTFHDPTLDALVARARASNLDLLEAGSRIRQARAQEAVAGAGGLPQVTAMGSALRLDRSASAPSPLAALGGGATSATNSTGAPNAGVSHFDYFTAGFDASWELDLFGGVRRGVEAARATRESQVWSRRDTEVGLIAEVADDYLQLRLAQARLAVLRADQARRSSLLRLVGERFQTGFVTTVDVEQQRNQLASTEAQIPQVEAQAQISIHALGILLGEPPETLSAELATAASLPPTPPTLPVGLPSELLARRPDVRAAERRLAAASAQIGVSTAALYPKVNLLGLASLGSADLSTLLRGSNAISAGLGMVQWSAFDAGRSRAAVRLAREAYVQAELDDRRTVLTALREVEDALVRYAAEQRRWTALKGAYGAAQASYDVAGKEYTVGLVDYTRLYEAQGALLAAEDPLTQSRAQLARDMVAIYKALGGGWSLGG